jgi:ATP-dependent Zn protease
VNFVTRTVLFWLFILVCLVMLWSVVNRSATTGRDTEVSFSNLINMVRQGLVLDATIEGNELRGHLKASPKEQFHTTLPANQHGLEEALLAAGINFTIKAPQNQFLKSLLMNVGPLAILLLVALPPFWAIFRKAGFSPWLSLLMLIPAVNLVALYIMAFSKWKGVSPPAA